MSKYRVLVMTSDKYLPALLPFAYLFNKYWKPNPQVIVSGFTRPDFELPDNFEFVSVGEFADYPVNRWTNALYKTAQMVKDEVAVLMLEDYWLTRPVNVAVVDIMYDYMMQFRNVIKVDLRTDRLYAAHANLEYGHAGYVDLVKSMPGSPYHLSLMTGLWRMEHLISVIEPNWTPWDVEIVGTTRLSHRQDLLVLGTRQNPVKHTLAFRSQDSTRLLLDEIPQHDVDEMRSRGYLEHWEE
jgi:hypothetical protein